MKVQSRTEISNSIEEKNREGLPKISTTYFLVDKMTAEISQANKNC